jgi:hypothetical protein
MMTFHRRHPSVSIAIVDTDPGWSQFDFQSATARLLVALEDDSPSYRKASVKAEGIKSISPVEVDQTVPPTRDGFFKSPLDLGQQPIALRGTAFGSWSDYDRAVRDRLSGLAAAALAAAAFVQPAQTSPPEHYEFRFCLPAPRTAVRVVAR